MISVDRTKIHKEWEVDAPKNNMPKASITHNIKYAHNIDTGRNKNMPQHLTRAKLLEQVGWQKYKASKTTSALSTTAGATAASSPAARTTTTATPSTTESDNCQNGQMIAVREGTTKNIGNITS
jgi:hypothetical protein